MNVFDDVIAKLEERGAFKDVPVPDGVVLPGEFESLKPAGNLPFPIKYFIYRYDMVVPQAVSDYQFRNFSEALKIYLPESIFTPWSRQYAKRSLSKPLTRRVSEQISANAVSLIEHYRIQEISSKKPPDIQPGLSEAAKSGLKEAKICIEVLKKHPALMTAGTLFQASHLEFLYRLALRLRNTQSFSNEARIDAANAIEHLIVNFSTNNFILGPIMGIANAYQQRTQGDYSQPFISEDFTKAWNALHNKRGFLTRMVNNDETQVISRCPFKGRAIAGSAQMAGEETCGENKTQLRAAMGYGMWCLYNTIHHTRMGQTIKYQTQRAQRIIHSDLTTLSAQEDRAPYEERAELLMSDIRRGSGVKGITYRSGLIERNLRALKYTVQHHIS